MSLDDNVIKHPNFEVAVDEQYLSAQHDDMPLYTPFLQNT
jgi:hypothetical protein